MIRFQTATPSDAQELAKLVNSAYRGEYSQKGWTTEAALLGGQRTDAEALTKLIETPNNQIEIIYQGKSEKMIGCVHLIQEPPDTLYFGMLTVEPTMQGQGLGKNLLTMIENVARGFGYKRVRFTVIPTRTELVDFYQRRGFKPTGKFEAFPELDPRFGLPKVKDLVLKEFEKQLTDKNFG
ncbi:MAG: GNAT family N-acetyltransferase [Bdellovibrionales bacterium]|nr:GNAT family N-acetyltransferase [Bdellovibrionales bacterium]